MRTRCTFRLNVLAVSLGAVFSGLGNAAESGASNAETALAPVVIEGGTGYRTTGTKSALKPIEAPMSYEIYDAELLEARQVDSVNEALRYVPGVTPESRATVTIFDQYTIRGFESYRNYYDGLPLQYNGLWNLVPQVDAFATQSVEVLKGPTSVLYGSAPPGGMVNQTAKLPQSTPSTLLRARVGTGDLRELAVDSTGAITDAVDYRLLALTRREDGQQQTTHEERHLFAPSVTWRISDATRVNFNLYHQRDPDLTPSTPLPARGTLYLAPYGRLDSDAYAGDKNWSGFERNVTMAGWKLEHQFSDSVTFMQNFRHTEGDAFQRNTYNLGLRADGRTLDRSAYYTDEEQTGFVVDNQLALAFETGALRHKFLFGLEYQELQSDVRYGDTLGMSTPSIDLANPSYRRMTRTSLPLDFYTEIHDIEQSQLGLYLQDEIKWGKLTVVAGVRRDHFESEDVADKTYNGFAYGDRTEISQWATSGRLAALYAFDNGIAPYANYSESFEPVSGVDSLTGAAFKPTTAKQLEAGLKYRSGNGNAEMTLAWFDIRKENVVVNTPDFARKTQNGEVQSEGVELSWRQVVGDSADLTLALTHMNVRVTDNPLDPALVGNTPVWVAERQASLWGNYYVTPNLTMSGGIRYVGESQMDAANSDTVPSYTLVDVATSYQIDPRYRVGFTVSNLFDKRYVGACYDVNNCWMGAERSVELTLSASF